MNLVNLLTPARPASADGAPVLPGTVTLVGAGPGDPELLTVKAVKALQAARLVLYDHLVSPAVLDHLSPDAERIYVGKESSRHTLPQASIIELMVVMTIIATLLMIAMPRYFQSLERAREATLR